MKKTLIFDFDGTIADTFSAVKGIVNELADKYGYRKMTDAEFESLRAEGAKTILKSLNLSVIKIPLWILEVKQELTKLISNIKAFDNIPSVLKELKNSEHRLGILTSNSLENIELFLINNNLNFFDFVHTENNLFGKDKALAHLINKYALNKRSVLYIGDEIRDIEACKKVEVDVCAVTWGYNNVGGLTNAKPNFLINTPNELITILTSYL